MRCVNLQGTSSCVRYFKNQKQNEPFFLRNLTRDTHICTIFVISWPFKKTWEKHLL